ncbi:hypothetical protein ACLKMH_15545 [Psychromonas sp. KJ10-10]|uniref:hypothetical protein n=1 Tax=Psychromonas sp. KJ10-10 TaxID=3391823 RepID=UPI0039B4EC35
MTDNKKVASTKAETTQLNRVSPTLDANTSTASTTNKPPLMAEYVEIACDHLLQLGTQGISKTGAHALFSDGAFNTTVSKLKKKYNINLSRELRTKTSKLGKKVHPMFYWIKDKNMAREVVLLSNRLKLLRNAEPISAKLESILLNNFPE